MLSVMIKMSDIIFIFGSFCKANMISRAFTKF